MFHEQRVGRSAARWCLALLLAVMLLTFLIPLAIAQDSEPSDGSAESTTPKREGTMTLKRMDEIIRRLDGETKSARLGIWQFEIEKRTVMIVTDAKNDRMRIMVPIGPAANVDGKLMKRLMQANFDTALDSRYAVAREILWSTFIHPLKAMHDRQFVEAIGQTVNLAVTFGTTYSSGLLSFGGGDSRGIIQRKLIDGLLRKGLPI